MTVNERVFNTVIGSNVLLWSVLGIALSGTDDRWTPVRVSISLLNALVGILFLVRRPLLRSASWQACLLAFPSFIAWGVSFRFSPELAHWPLHAQALFTAAAAVTGMSLLSLGQSFAVLPAARGTVTRGLYGFVRHPVYAGELAMIAACFLAGPSLVALVPLAAAFPCVAVRLLAEERLLHSSEDYRAYAQRVRWRLVPYVW